MHKGGAPTIDAPLTGRLGPASGDNLGADGDSTTNPGPPDPERRSPHLRMILVLLDAALLVVGWWVGQLVLGASASGPGPSSAEMVLTGPIAVGAGLFIMGAAGLYRRLICSVRRREVARLGAAVAIHAPFLVLLNLQHGLGTATAAAAAAGAVSFPILVGARGLMREWIQVRRAAGDFAAPVVVVGGTSEGLERTAAFVANNVVLGYRVRGLVGPPVTRPGAMDWLDDVSEVVAEMQAVGASGAVLDARTLTGAQLSNATMQLTDLGYHVHVSTGLSGVDGRRVTVSPLADETFLHVAPATLSRRQKVAKRLVDVVIGSIGLLVAAPVLVAAAIAIWLEDRGPILFRQRRVGQEGELFTMYKLRTMVTDAEARRAEMLQANERDGPLFKMSSDPRVTRVGRVLRLMSIDELPQLFNAVEGTMSLVGPRPALVSEVEEFDEVLRRRMTVKPGLTGLWQVEARDLASFDLYRRYDIMYVRNWSVAGDLGLIGRTIASLGVRSVTGLARAMRGSGHVRDTG